VLEEGVNGRLFDLAAGPEGFAASLRPMLSDPESLEACRHASLAKARAFDLEPVLGQYEQILAEAAR